MPLAWMLKSAAGSADLIPADSLGFGESQIHTDIFPIAGNITQ
jgi:hypothetical protein